MQSIPSLYQKYFIDPGIERLALFENFGNTYPCEKALYPGSFVHISPSLYFPVVVYLDLDKRCRKFFSDDKTLEYINSRKAYRQKPVIRFHENSFENEIDEEMNISADNLDQYFTFTRKKDLDIEDVLRTMKGPKYRRMADSYIFKKSGPGS